MIMGKIAAALSEVGKPKQVIDQGVLISIFIAYLKLQYQRDLEKSVKEPRYIPLYYQKDIEAIIGKIQTGFCKGFCSFIGHKLRRHQLKEIADELLRLQPLYHVGFKSDGSFLDNGKYLISKGNPSVPESDRLNRKNNEMVALIEDVFSNLQWLQCSQSKRFIRSEEIYSLSEKENSDLTSLLSDFPLDIKKITAFCLQTFGAEDLLPVQAWNDDIKKKLHSIFRQSGTSAALCYLNELFNGELEKAIRKKKYIKEMIFQDDVARLINFVADKETPPLKNNFNLVVICFKEEIEGILKNTLSGLELESTKIIKIGNNEHAVLAYKENESYYFINPNNGILYGPYIQNPYKEIAKLLLKCYASSQFLIGVCLKINVFGEFIEDKSPKINEIITNLFNKRYKIYGNSFVELTCNGERSLHLAARLGYVELVQELLKINADIAATDSQGFTPLHLAAYFGHADVVQVLLKNKAKTNATNAKGFSALHLAAKGGHANVVKKLLESKADIVAKDYKGYTALHWAAERGYANVVLELLSYSVDIAVEINFAGKTALQLAKRSNHPEVVSILRCLQKGKNKKKIIREIGNDLDEQSNRFVPKRRKLKCPMPVASKR